MPKQKKVEFIESYLKAWNDYQWHDNHGELVRCKDCVVPHNIYTGCPKVGGRIVTDDWYCADGVRKEDE